MVTCGVCGETANPGSIFCRRCGAELPRRRVPTPDDQTTVLPQLDPTGPAAPIPPAGSGQPAFPASPPGTDGPASPPAPTSAAGPASPPAPTSAAGPRAPRHGAPTAEDGGTPQSQPAWPRYEPISSEQPTIRQPRANPPPSDYPTAPANSPSDYPTAAGYPPPADYPTAPSDYPTAAGYPPPAGYLQAAGYPQTTNQPPANPPGEYLPPGYQQTFAKPTQPAQPTRPAFHSPPPAARPGRYETPQGGYEPPVFLPADQRPPRSPRNRNGTIAAIIGGVLVLVLAAFAIAIVLLSKDSSKSGVAQPAPLTHAASTPARAPSSPPTSVAPTKPKPTPTPTNTKLRAAQTLALKQLGVLVNQSGSARAGISTALDQIGGCTSLNAAIGTLSNASNTRQSLATQAGKLNLAALPTGAQLISSFTSSMRESSLADQQYANWARQVRPSCKKTAKHTSAYAAAQVHDGSATAAKQRFAEQFNAVARTLGLSGITAGQF